MNPVVSVKLTLMCLMFQCREILQEEEDLSEIVQLVGKVSGDKHTHTCMHRHTQSHIHPDTHTQTHTVMHTPRHTYTDRDTHKPMHTHMLSRMHRHT